jgi:hypothetical protein
VRYPTHSDDLNAFAHSPRETGHACPAQRWNKPVLAVVAAAADTLLGLPPVTEAFAHKINRTLRELFASCDDCSHRRLSSYVY